MYPHLPAAPHEVHRTTAFSAQHHSVWPHSELPAGPHWAHAVCRCGWAECAESRHDARVLARHHRRFAAERQAFYLGRALRIGERAYQADATGIHVSITGRQQAWAVADGIDDGPLPADAAGTAASVASSVAAERGSVAGLLATTDALSGLASEDTVMVVATPLPECRGGGWDIAWVGDCRAYEYHPDTHLLAQLILDHTRGQELRHCPAPRYEGRLDELEQLAEPHDRVVTSSVGSATPSTLGHVTTVGPRRHLLLTSDGVHKAVPRRSIARAARRFRDPRTCAHKLTIVAQYFGGTDNAAAMVIDPQPGCDGVGLAP